MYYTENELHHFDFKEAIVDEIRLMNGNFHVYMENVKILPDNSCNRDIRLMRTNDLELILKNATILRVVEEGFKRYNANGALVESIDDTIIPVLQYTDLFHELEGATLCELQKEEDIYTFCMDGEERTYDVVVGASTAVAQWEHFLNI